MRAVVAVLALIILAYSLSGVVPIAHAQRRAFLRVHVIDQNAWNYANVTVEVWRVVLVDSGKTDADGLWRTRLDGDGRAYDVKVFNGDSMTRNVEIIAADVFVEFSLERLAPAPRLAVSGVEYSPPRVAAGDTVDTRIMVTNLGSLKANSTLLRFISPPAGITILQTGTAFDLGPLDVDASANVTAKFNVDLTAATGPYLLQYELSYGSETGYSYQDEGEFGMFVGGVPEVKIHDVIVDPSTLTRGTDGVLTVKLTNAGTEVAKKVVIRMHNADMLTSTISYAGVIERGSFVDQFFGIHVDQYEPVGIHLLNITITYMDPKGNSFVESKLYQMEVVPAIIMLPQYDIWLGVLSFALLMVAFFSVKRLGFRL